MRTTKLPKVPVKHPIAFRTVWMLACGSLVNAGLYIGGKRTHDGKPLVELFADTMLCRVSDSVPDRDDRY